MGDKTKKTRTYNLFYEDAPTWASADSGLTIVLVLGSFTTELRANMTHDGQTIYHINNSRNRNQAEPPEYQKPKGLHCRVSKRDQQT
jgi:hypothetical protein